MLHWKCNAGRCVCGGGNTSTSTTDPTSSHEGVIGGAYLE